MTMYLGIDFGLSHLGLAIAETNLATPLPSLRNDQTTFSLLSTIISREGVTTIVCGLPEGKLVPTIQKFSDELQRRTGVPVILHPETLSTQEAKQKLHTIGASRTKRQNDHAYAACLILEDYLELHSPMLY